MKVLGSRIEPRYISASKPFTLPGTTMEVENDPKRKTMKSTTNRWCHPLPSEFRVLWGSDLLATHADVPPIQSGVWAPQGGATLCSHGRRAHGGVPHAREAPSEGGQESSRAYVEGHPSWGKWRSRTIILVAWMGLVDVP